MSRAGQTNHNAFIERDVFWLQCDNRRNFAVNPEKGIRHKIKCSNLRDILSSLTRLIGPNQQPQKEESMVEGMRDFLQMLAATPLGSTQINDPMLRKLFQQYRKELT